jgi:outer membrane receptor protein involved in Fe transport
MFGKISTRVCEINWRGRLLTSAAVLALSTTAFAGSALAQDPPPAETSAPPPAEEIGAPPMAVEKVVVTATRRETSLIKTPVAVTAISGKTLAAAEVENIEDLMAVVPSLVVTNNGHPFAFTTRIRGIGTQGDNPGLEAAVGTFIDGVYRSRPGVAMSDLGELERVEVLRGPQGTLFGRNTSAGIINVLSKKPTWENEIWGEVTGGSYDLLAARGGFNAMIAPDTLAARFNFVRQEREGYIDVNPGRSDPYDGNATSFWGGRGQLLWQPNQDVSLRLIGDYAEREDQCCSAVTLFNGSFGRAPTLAFPDTSGPAIINFIEGVGKSTTNQVDNRIAFGDRSTNTNTTDKGVSGELNWRFGGVKLTSITSYREWENDYGQDIDFSGADIAYFPGDGTNFNKFETITHESRLNGETGWVNWLVGVFYSNEDISRQQRFTWGADAETFLSLHRVPGDSPLAYRIALGLGAGTAAITPNTGYTDNFEQNAESFAAFTHNVFHITDDLDFIAGLRWTTETKDFRASYQTANQAGCSALEGTFGLDPSAQAALLGLPAATQRLIALTCAPFSRNALDGFTAAAPHLQERTEDEFSGIATLAYQFNPNVNTYATYSRGHKAGGFNLDRVFRDALGSVVVPPVLPGPQTVRAPDTSFDSELVDAYELGLKLASDDNTFQMNVAGFYQDFENFQLNTFTGVSFIVTSVPEVISKGVEVETFWSPFRDFTTNLGVAWTDARYGDDLGAFVTQNVGLFALPGERLTHSPEWTVTGGFDYSFPFLDTLTARLHMDGRWQSEMNTGSNLDPRKIQDAYAVFGAKLGFYSEDELFGLEFFARNLFDEGYINTAFDSPLQGTAFCSNTLDPTFCPLGASQSSTIDAFVGEPRMLGATLRIRN